MRTTSIFLSSCIGLTALLGSGAVGAETNQTRAESEFRSGIDAMRTSKVSEACRHFAEADRLDRKVGYVVNLARCESKEGRLLASRETWKRAFELATETKDTRRNDVEKGLRAAEEEVPRVEALGDSRNINATLDGTHVEVERLQSGVDVDLGKHALVFSKAGHIPARREFEVKRPQERVKIAIPVLASDAPPEVPTAPAVQATSTKPDRALGMALSEPRSQLTAAPATPWMRYAAVGLVAGGVSALGMGGYFAIRASGKNNDSLARCPETRCSDDEAVQLRAEARESANLATISLITGGVLAAGGVTV